MIDNALPSKEAIIQSTLSLAADLVEVLDEETALELKEFLVRGPELQTRKRALHEKLVTAVNEATAKPATITPRMFDRMEAAVQNVVEAASRNEARMAGIRQGSLAIQSAISQVIAEKIGDGTYTRSGSRRQADSNRKILAT